MTEQSEGWGGEGGCCTLVITNGRALVVVREIERGLEGGGREEKEMGAHGTGNGEGRGGGEGGGGEKDQEGIAMGREVKVARGGAEWASE